MHGQRKAGSTCISSNRITLKTFLSAEKVVVCMLEQISLKCSLNLGHIDVNFEVLYVVNNSYCDRKHRITERDNIVCKAFWFTLFCLTGFPVVFGDKTGDDITKAHIGNTSWLYEVAAVLDP